MNRKVLAAVVLVIPMLVLGAAVWVTAAPVEAPSATLEAEVVADFHTWDSQDPAYEGGRTGCRRCHLGTYRSWERTPHAKTFEVLPEENRGNAECLKCHTTGYGATGGFTSIDDTPNLANVGCEVCHGPGSLYKDKEVMEDHDAAVAAGLKIPTEQTCTACHNSDSPTFSGSFDFEAMKASGVHEIG